MRRPITSRTWIGTDAQVVRHVRVCGIGHLAAATRIELECQGIHRHCDDRLPSLRPPLIIGCADSEADESLNEAARQAFEFGSPLLLCCLAGRVVRVGPLIEPSTFPDPARGRPAASAHEASPLPGGLTEPGIPLRPQARLAALLVSAQALNFLLGARNRCVLNQVIELNPWSMESKGYRVLQH